MCRAIPVPVPADRIRHMGRALRMTTCTRTSRCTSSSVVLPLVRPLMRLPPFCLRACPGVPRPDHVASVLPHAPHGAVCNASRDCRLTKGALAAPAIPRHFAPHPLHSAEPSLVVTTCLSCHVRSQVQAACARLARLRAISGSCHMCRLHSCHLHRHRHAQQRSRWRPSSRR